MKQTGFTHEVNSYECPVEWYTPPEIFDALGVQFDLDPASPGREVVPWIPAAAHYTLADDGLKADWRGNVWLNPPYGPATPTWIDRFIQHGHGMMLVFARTDTAWFHRIAPIADALLFVKGRVKFVPSRPQQGNGGAGAGSLLIALGRENADALKLSGLGFYCEAREQK